jgi:spoIIIJ-associated protein
MTSSDLSQKLENFVTAVLTAMGAEATVAVVESPDGFRIDVDGEGAETLLFHRGEALSAFQTIVNTAFRRDLGDARKVLVDCQGFRRDKDAELKQMARFLAEKVRTSGATQEIGPLNSYERRIVHMTVAEVEGLSSESIGDAAVKTVIISPKLRA